MAVGLSDILSALKNLVQAVSNLAPPRQTSKSVGTATLAITGTGMLTGVSVTLGGTADGFIYDASSITGLTPANILMAIPTVAGFYPVSLAYGVGLVVSPGAGQSANITYTKAT
jgi:hypothetical protein